MGCLKNKRLSVRNRRSRQYARFGHSRKRKFATTVKQYSVELVGPTKLLFKLDLSSLDSAVSINTVISKPQALVHVQKAVRWAKLKSRKKVLCSNISGARIINLALLCTHVHSLTLHAAMCDQCHSYAQSHGEAIKVHGEINRDGLASILFAQCCGCKKTWHLTTCNKIKGPTGNKRWEVNLAAVWGQMATGGGAQPMNQFLSTMGVPGMSAPTFSSIEEQIGLWWRSVLEDEMLKAGEEEKFLAEQNGEYFDGVPKIKVICDGGWSKRTHKHSYIALSGVGIVIGARTKKILGLGVRNKYCSTCNLAATQHRDPPYHKCYKNWDLSSQAMEPDILLELFLEGETKHGLRYMTFIGDGDSAVLKILQTKIPRWGAHIQKVECANHICKNIRCSLENLVKQNPAYKGRGRLTQKNRSRICIGIRCAIKMRSQNPDKMKAARLLEHDILNAGRHVLGDHTNCSADFCKNGCDQQNKSSGDSGQTKKRKRASKHKKKTRDGDEVSSFIQEQSEYAYEAERDITPEEEEEVRRGSPAVVGDHDDIFDKMMSDILMILSRYAGKAPRLLENQTSNLAECYMSIRTNLDGGKQIFRSGHGSFNHRSVGAGLRMNIGPMWPAVVWRKTFNTQPNQVFSGQFVDMLVKHDYSQKRKRDPEVIQSRKRRKYGRSTESSTQAARTAYCSNGEQNSTDIPDMSEEALESVKQLFYDANVKVSAERAIEIEAQTHGQSKCGIWLQERHLRLTASNFGKVFSLRQTTVTDKILKSLLYSSWSGNSHTEYGLNHEDATKADYIRYMQNKGHDKVIVHDAGLFVSLTDNCLAATPDGIVDDGTDEQGLVEFKNISAHSDKTILEIFHEKEQTKKWGNFCLRRVGESSQLTLHHKHPYYYQVQGLLHITGKSWCDVVVRAKDLHVERVYPDNSLWLKMKKKLIAFYLNVMLPELASPRYPAKFRNAKNWVKFPMIL